MYLLGIYEDAVTGRHCHLLWADLPEYSSFCNYAKLEFDMPVPVDVIIGVIRKMT